MALSKAEVCRAFREVMAADYADVPAREEIDHVFSPEFYAKMAALIAEQKRGSWRLLSRQRRRALVVAAILAVSMLLVACTPKLREAVSELVVTVYETFVDFIAPAQADIAPGTEIETIYGFNPVPDGFEMVSQEFVSPYRVETTYRNKTSVIVINQASYNNVIGFADLENGNALSKTIDGLQVFFSSTEDSCSAAWIHDGYYFDVCYFPQISQTDFENLIMLVNSTD